MKKIKIANKTIGYGEPCFVIADAGVNHDGELEKALRLVDIAADAGADAVKFQTFKAEQVVTDAGEMAEYQKKNTGYEKSQREMLRELELKEEFYPPIIERCAQRNIIFLSTPHGGRASVDLLESFNLPAYKVGSGDITNYILLERIAKKRKLIILSSGMANLQEVKDAIAFVSSCGAMDIVMLHCTTNYPCPPEEVNLRAMATMMNELDVVVGYSDHTKGDQTAIMAVTMGAAVYERHFSVDPTLPGPDHIASDSPEEFSRKVKAIRAVPIILGSGEKTPTATERGPIRVIARRSIVATHDMSQGHTLTEEDIEAKRPGSGTSPIHYREFIGKKLKKAARLDEQLSLEDTE